ncbi:hypothetical protein NQ117_00390 [Paenibacillus sp. SC116]|uniref:hypothetical protein n=1 Tax=Paenibacillus sp. SC116 TaxID=2968986 RepID=UPI00215B5801|nr:hypothetical protein [Paenibacillus sp. SC116]MCR8842131.1 hypothetical protein [Paenibacillus sp. SC116]
MKRDDVILLVNHLYTMHEALKESYMPRIPGNAQVHFRAMKKEALLGTRSLLDAVIEGLDNSADRGAVSAQQNKPNQGHGGQVNIEGRRSHRSSSSNIEITD